MRVSVLFLVLLGILWAAAAAYLGTRPGAGPANKTALWVACVGLLTIPVATATVALLNLFGKELRGFDFLAWAPLASGVGFAFCYSNSQPGGLASFYLASAVVLVPVGLLALAVLSLSGGGWH